MGLIMNMTTANITQAIAINANGMDYYVHGIVGCETIAGSEYCEAGSVDNHTPCDPTALDHAVLAVGYGVQNGTAYWVIKLQLDCPGTPPFSTAERNQASTLLRPRQNAVVRPLAN